MSHLRLCVFAAGLFAAAVLSAQEVSTNNPATPSYTALSSSTLWDIFERGGRVMWVILGGGVIGLVLAIERGVDLRRNKHCPKDFQKDVVHVVDTRGVDAGLALCLQKQSSLSRVLYGALLRHGTSRREMEVAVTDESGRVRYDLRRNTRVIGLMAVLAPLLGLFGASIQLLAGFDNIASGKMELMSGVAISALLPLALGLFVAVLLVPLYALLKNKANDIVRDIDERATEAVVTLDRKARQSIRLIEDIEEQTKTKDMVAVKQLPPDLAKEIEIDRTQGSGIKSSITTHTGTPVVKNEEKKV